MVYGLYTRVLVPTITYASLVWWHKANQGYAVKIFTKVQRIVCLDVMRAMVPTPTVAIDTILVLPPLQPVVRRSECNRAKSFANRASKALVREKINYHRLAKIGITQECEEIKQRIREILNEEDFANMCAAVERGYTRINGQLKDKHRKKLKSLIRQKESSSVDPRKTVINLCTPTRVPTLDMILVVEMAAGKIQPPEAADEYRWKVRTAIKKAKPKQIRQNISKAEQRSLRELMSDKILPADKETLR
ncbi:hypothetical protein Trydic_g21665 [Trypoxylus dichotomus]